MKGLEAFIAGLGTLLAVTILVLVTFALIQNALTPQEDPAQWVRDRAAAERAAATR